MSGADVNLKSKISERSAKFGFGAAALASKGGTTATRIPLSPSLSPAAESASAGRSKMDFSVGISFDAFDATIHAESVMAMTAYEFVFQATPPPSSSAPVRMEVDTPTTLSEDPSSEHEHEEADNDTQQHAQQQKRGVLEEIIMAIRSSSDSSLDPALKCGVATVKWLQAHMGTNLDEFAARKDHTLRFKTAQIFMANCLARLLMPRRCTKTRQQLTERGGNDAMKFATVCALHVSVRVKEELFAPPVNRLRETLANSAHGLRSLPQNRVLSCTANAPIVRVRKLRRNGSVCCDMSHKPIQESTYTEFMLFRCDTHNDASIEEVAVENQEATDYELITRLVAACSLETPYARVRVANHYRTLVELFIAAQDIEAYVTLALQVWLNKSPHGASGYAQEAEIKRFSVDCDFHRSLHHAMKRILHQITQFSDAAASAMVAKHASKRVRDSTSEKAEEEATNVSKKQKRG